LHIQFGKKFRTGQSSWFRYRLEIQRSLIGGKKELAHLPKKTRRIKAAFMMYGAWNIWKERNRWIFEHKERSPADVMHEIKTEVQARRLACGGPELS